jgi:hypothetical protein
MRCLQKRSAPPHSPEVNITRQGLNISTRGKSGNSLSAAQWGHVLASGVAKSILRWCSDKDTTAKDTLHIPYQALASQRLQMHR